MPSSSSPLPAWADAYLARVRHFVRVTDPRTLLVPPAQVREYQALLRDPARVRASAPDELEHARNVVAATIHPDTGEPVFLPFRMACFVPTNLVVTAGLLIPNPSIAATLFWQWANQSVNVAFNYCNANKTVEMDMKETGFAYATAVLSSCSIAVGLSRVVSSPFLKRFIPFVAVASAGSLNVALMRWKEVRDGVELLHPETREQIGVKSKQAGALAVGQVALSRVATAFPCLTIPPLLLSRLSGRLSPLPYQALHLSLITVCLMTALPLSIALFPQYGELRISDLEPAEQLLVREKLAPKKGWWGWKRSSGQEAATVLYNKGL